mgnify:CR=1 FL=1
MPPQGRTYGKFSGRGTSAYDVMTQAKKMGGKKRADEAYEKWQTEFEDWSDKRRWAKDFGSMVDILSMFVMPQILGKGTALEGLEGVEKYKAIAGNVGKKGLGAGLGFGFGSIAQKLMEQWTMGGGVAAKREAPEFIAPDVGIYGAQFMEPYKGEIASTREDVLKQIKQMYAERAKTHGLASFSDISIADILGKRV